VTYSPEAASYTMSPDQQTLTVKLFWNGNGLSVVKSFIFTKGSYDIQMKYDVTNRAGKAWTGYVYTQLARTEPLQQSSLLTHYATFTGGAISSPSDHYQKIKFDNFGTDATNQTTTQGWAAMVQQYFLSAWVPDPTLTYHYYSSVNNSTGVYTLGMMSSALTVSPGQTITANNQLYVGPAIASNLNQVSPHLSMTIDYGWLWFISQIIFWAMKIIFDIIGNWGWAIIVVTLIIKAIFYPLSNKSFHSMAKMRKLQPRIAQLKERFGDDRQAMSKAMMDLYREEKVNPLGGCLPMLVQIPVFIGLYWVIVQSVELRQAPWILWVNDLSIHDAYYILPVIMGGLMFLQQKLSPPPPDPTQAKVMMFMPIIFTALFLGFPSGLVLYWITNTLVTVIHQYVILLKYEREEKEKKITKANQKK
jgi:YidC/Oxa1 family membrane protein insertase